MTLLYAARDKKMNHAVVLEEAEVTIYHNPGCGTSRNTLALIRNAGVEPTINEYFKTPPDRSTLESLIKRMNIRPRDLLRQNGTPYGELGLGAGHWTDEQLIDSEGRRVPTTS
jgi:arsenate reductase